MNIVYFENDTLCSLQRQRQTNLDGLWNWRIRNFNSLNKDNISIQEPVNFAIQIFSEHFLIATDSWSSVSYST